MKRFLPTDDFSDIENDENELDIEIEEITEPSGIGEIVNKSQPLINEIVKPRVGEMRNEIKETTEGKGKENNIKIFIVIMIVLHHKLVILMD